MDYAVAQIYYQKAENQSDLMVESISAPCFPSFFRNTHFVLDSFRMREVQA
jgi:hypothetical protein